MGGSFSVVYKRLRNFTYKYNAENRALKFIQKESLPVAPRHVTSATETLKENPEYQEELKKIHLKNENLAEYLKKVYLTSTSEIIKSPAVGGPERKLPVLTERTLTTMFYEPEKPSPGSCTLSKIVEMMIRFQEDPKNWNVNALAKHYHLNAASVVQILSYYSLFELKDTSFFKQEPEESDKQEEQKKVKFEVYTPLEKKPVRQIEGK